MTGSGVAVILIPVAGTLCLTARLALVFHAEGHPGRPLAPADLGRTLCT